jgi:hypothetical protein
MTTISPAFRDILETTLCHLGNPRFISCCEPWDLERKFWVIYHFIWQFLAHKPMPMICTNHADIYRKSVFLPQIPDACLTEGVTYNLSPKWHSTVLHRWLCKPSTFSPVWPLERQPECSLSSTAYPKSESEKKTAQKSMFSPWQCHWKPFWALHMFLMEFSWISSQT